MAGAHTIVSNRSSRQASHITERATEGLRNHTEEGIAADAETARTNAATALSKAQKELHDAEFALPQDPNRILAAQQAAGRAKIDFGKADIARDNTGKAADKATAKDDADTADSRFRTADADNAAQGPTTQGPTFPDPAKLGPIQDPTTSGPVKQAPTGNACRQVVADAAVPNCPITGRADSAARPTTGTGAAGIGPETGATSTGTGSSTSTSNGGSSNTGTKGSTT